MHIFQLVSLYTYKIHPHIGLMGNVARYMYCMSMYREPQVRENVGLGLTLEIIMYMYFSDLLDLSHVYHKTDTTKPKTTT